MLHITKALVTDLLTEAVLARGADYVAPKFDSLDNREDTYGTCRYRLPGTQSEPSCIVGWIAHRLNILGVIKEGLGAFNVFDALIGADLLILDDDAKTMLTVAQQTQDDGAPWLKALVKALESV